MELVSPLLVNAIAVIAIVVGLMLAAWFVVALYGVYSREREPEMPTIDLPAQLREVLTGLPPAMIIFGVFIAVSLVGYVLYIRLGGITY